jgi:acyl-CoA thioesterase
LTRLSPSMASTTVLLPLGILTESRRDRTRNSFVTLNHTIHFHWFDGWSADGLDGGVYVELRSPWAKDGRVLAHSTIFGRDGVVVATCAQEGYISLRHDKETTERKAKL